VAVLAEFDHDPPAAHLVGDGAGSAGAGEGIENPVAGVGTDLDDSFHQALGFWCPEAHVCTE
jgi:hypothetical protein